MLSIDLVSAVTPSMASATANGPSEAPSLSFDGRYLAFQSEAANLAAGDTNADRDIFVTDLQTETVVRASTGSAGEEADNDSREAALSADGRYVAFSSDAANLVAGDTNVMRDVFVKDLQSGLTVRASTNSAVGEANGESRAASLSADGRYVAFSSDATNLVPGDTNGVADVFVKDLQSGATIRVSTGGAGAQADGASTGARMSGDGRYVAFSSEAANLVAGDTNGIADLFVKDLAGGAIVRASVSSAGGQLNGDSNSPSFSGDGRYVAFRSYATNLVPGDTNAQPDVFVKDLASGAVTLVSTSGSGVLGNVSSENPTLSGDGRYVAFRSYATNLVAGDTNGVVDVFVKDLASGTTTRVSTDSAGKASNNDSYLPVISGDGLRVAFETDATNLIAKDTNAAPDIAVKTLADGAVQAGSPAAIPQWGGNNNSNSPSSSADGRYVAFASDADNLVAGDTNKKTDVFRKDLQSGTVVRVSASGTGTQGNKDSLAPSISADGRYVAFRSYASNLVANDNNNEVDVFVKDLQSGAIVQASLNANGVAADDMCYNPSISADGRYVAFTSDATNLVPGDTNGYGDVFVKDLQGGAVILASPGLGGAPADSYSTQPALSADGRYVAFTSYAANLVADDSNQTADVFVMDLRSGTLVRASTDAAGRQANENSLEPAASADGRYVAFRSFASNLVAGDFNAMSDVFVKDLQSGAIVRASTDSEGKQGDGASSQPSLSGDGRLVAFASEAGHLVDEDDNTDTDVFVKDLQTGVTTRLSVNAAGQEGNADSEDPSLSANGRFVAFASVASNLHANDTTEIQDVFRASLAMPVTPTTLGLFDPAASTFYLRSSNTTGAADYTFGFGEPQAGWQVLTGDWDGDGAAGVGLYDPQSSLFYLSDSYTTGYADRLIGFGEPQAGWIPLVGDWDGDGAAGVGLYDPQASIFYLTNTLQSGAAEITIAYGQPAAGWTPLVGDWDGNGAAGVGLYDGQASIFYLKNSLTSGVADRTFGFGEPGAGWQPLVGDWNGDWSAGVGLYDPHASGFYLTNSLRAGYADILYGYGSPENGWKPLVGDWNGDMQDGVGLFAPSGSTFYLSDTFFSGVADYQVGFGQPGAGWQPLVGRWSQPAPSAKAVDQLDLASLVAQELARDTAGDELELGLGMGG